MFHIRLLENYSETQASTIRTGWGQLLAMSGEDNLFYQSPCYFDHLAERAAHGEVLLAIAECADGELKGVVPLRRTRTALKFAIRDLCFLNLSFSGLKVLGGGLLVPSEFFDSLFEHLTASLKDCAVIEIRGVRTDSALWAYFNENQTLPSRFILYAPEGRRWCHTIDVPDSYEGYLSFFKRKKRYNLTRQVRLLEEWSKGRLSLVRVQTASDIPTLENAFLFLEQNKTRAENELDESVILDLAKRGLLLAYVLKIDDSPCALAFGTVFMGTLSIHLVKHDRRLDHFSPGTVMHMLLMRDLIDNKLAHRIDFGFGEPKARLSSAQDERITVFLVRKTLLNRLAITAHAAFQKLLASIKHFLANVANQPSRVGTNAHHALWHSIRVGTKTAP